MTGPKSSDDNASQSQSQISEDDADARLYFPQWFASNGVEKTGTGASAGGYRGGLMPEHEPMATEALYGGMFDADAQDELMDMGLQIGRLCISERYLGT